MEIIIDRKYKKPNYIIGNMLVDGRWFCNTMEPPIGTPLESVTAGSRKAIPPGTYNIKMQWSPKFGKMLPLIYTPGTNPPRVLGSLPLRGGMGRGSILIHPGNYPRDSVGCILVGLNTQKGMLTDSRKTTDGLIEMIDQAIADDEEVKVVIK